MAPPHRGRYVSDPSSRWPSPSTPTHGPERRALLPVRAAYAAEALRAYVERWARILLARRDVPRTRLRIVDACAGAGQDDSGNPGSPLISIREAEAASEQLTELRGEPVHVEVVAIEKDATRFVQLAAAISAFDGRHRALAGTLADHIRELEREFATVPTLAFIDPFGLDPLRADVVRRVLRGPKNEVLLLFADQAALRHIGAAAAAERVDEPQPTLFDDEPPEPLRADAAHLEMTADAARRIMTAAFGDERWREVLDLRAPRRRQAIVDLYARLLCSMGAGHVLPLPIIGTGNRLRYHLMFASRSGRGLEVMKDAVERGWKSGGVGETAVAMMRLGVAGPVPEIERMVLERFAGRQIGWTGTDSRASVRAFALRETPAMPYQLPELKQRLERFRLPGRAVGYAFPPFAATA